MSRVLVIVVVLAAVSFVGSPPAHACSCAGDLTEVVEAMGRGEIERPAAVFSGTIVASERSDSFGDGGVTHLYAVEAVHFGAVPDGIEIHTAGDSAACGYAIEGAHDVLAWRQDSGILTSDLCSTGVVDPDVLAATFGASVPALPTPTANPTDESENDDGGTSTRLILGAFAAAALVSGGLLLVATRNRSHA